MLWRLLSFSVGSRSIVVLSLACVHVFFAHLGFGNNSSVGISLITAAQEYWVGPLQWSICRLYLHSECLLRLVWTIFCLSCQPYVTNPSFCQRRRGYSYLSHHFCFPLPSSAGSNCLDSKWSNFDSCLVTWTRDGDHSTRKFAGSLLLGGDLTDPWRATTEGNVDQDLGGIFFVYPILFVKCHYYLHASLSAHYC